MNNKTDIANRALSVLGHAPISSYDENTPAGIIIRQHWTPTLRSLLRSHLWNFAIARAKFTAESVAPEFDWSFQYPLPSDCERLIELNGSPALLCRSLYVIEGRKMLTNSAAANVRYIRLVEDVTEWDSLFVEAFTYKLAAEIAMQLTGDLGKSQYAEGKFRSLTLPDAELVDATESPDDVAYPTGLSEYGGFYSDYADCPPRPTLGQPGFDGWTPLFEAKEVNSGVYLWVTWTGGSVNEPQAGWLGATGIVQDISLAVDISGQDGWTPVLASVIDGERRVHQVIDWVGGTGVKPDVGLYVSSAGLTPSIALATDIRGPAGPSTGIPIEDPGDMVIGDSMGNPATLPVGGDGKILGVSAGFPAWIDPPVSIPITTRGDLVVGDASGSAVRFPRGTSGQRLSTGASGDLEWVAPTPMTSANDMIIGGSGGAMARLAGPTFGDRRFLTTDNSGSVIGWDDLFSHIANIAPVHNQAAPLNAARRTQLFANIAAKRIIGIRQIVGAGGGVSTTSTTAYSEEGPYADFSCSDPTNANINLLVLAAINISAGRDPAAAGLKSIRLRLEAQTGSSSYTAVGTLTQFRTDTPSNTTVLFSPFTFCLMTNAHLWGSNWRPRVKFDALGAGSQAMVSGATFIGIEYEN